MADKKRWMLILLLTSSLGVGCVSPRRAPSGQASTPDGYQGTYLSAPPQVPPPQVPPPQVPVVTSNGDLQAQPSSSFSNVFKSTTGRITSSFQKMGDALAIQPKIEAPEDPLSLSTKTRPFGPDMYLAAARMFEQKGDLEHANLQMEKALELDPRNRETLISFARMKHRTGALDEANRLYRQVTQMFPEDPVAFNDLGLCLARQGRLEDSLAALSQAIDRRPDSKLYRNNIATVLLEAGRGDEALRQLTHVFGPGQAHHNLAYLFRERGDLANAQKYLAQAEQLAGRMATQANNVVQGVASQAETLSAGAVRVAALPTQSQIAVNPYAAAVGQQAQTYSANASQPVGRAAPNYQTGQQSTVQQVQLHHEVTRSLPGPQPYHPPVLSAPELP